MSLFAPRLSAGLRRAALPAVVILTVVVFTVVAVGVTAVLRLTGPAVTGPSHHHGSARSVQALSPARIVSCPPMTDGRDVTITVSCQIDRNVIAGNVVIAGATV